MNFWGNKVILEIEEEYTKVVIEKRQNNKNMSGELKEPGIGKRPEESSKEAPESLWNALELTQEKIEKWEKEKEKLENLGADKEKIREFEKKIKIAEEKRDKLEKAAKEELKKEKENIPFSKLSKEQQEKVKDALKQELEIGEEEEKKESSGE